MGAVEEIEVDIECNGEPLRARVAGDRLLADFLREEAGLTGTKVGCNTGDCGACTVLLDGEPVTSCLIYAAECRGRRVETIEGVAETPLGAAVADAFVAENAVQCGICTPGMVVSSYALLSREPRPSSEQIRTALAGNLCRCTGYYPIIAAVSAAGRRSLELGRGDDGAAGD